ncbi:MAG: hypothetical protein EOP52_12705 [Sphingobacteriales bacterium]|nr:MAG: hypothetical protein EOP52_12705 [Sphingobacteriales bacterium]
MKKLLLLPLSALLLHACARKAMPVAGNTDAATDCRAVMCTMDFRTVSLRVVDASGKPVKLDSYQTVLSGKGTAVLSGDAAASMLDGTYPVVTDEWVANHKNTTAKMIFIGMVGNKPVVTETFEIKADCCHVSKVSGKESITAR